MQAQLQADVSGAITAAANNTGFTGGVTVNVRDLGGGAWNVQIARNSTGSSSTLSVHNVDTLAVAAASPTTLGTLSGSATVSNTGGGVFQVGANVTANDQIAVSIDDIRVTSGTNLTYTALSAVDVTDTSANAASATTVDAAINAISSLRGKLGADQNRFQSTIANLQVTTENLSASESRIRDTDMASEMVNFTRDQILLQAGTAMLAQANAAPQSILRLLQ